MASRSFPPPDFARSYEDDERYYPDYYIDDRMMDSRKSSFSKSPPSFLSPTPSRLHHPPRDVRGSPPIQTSPPMRTSPPTHNSRTSPPTRKSPPARRSPPTSSPYHHSVTMKPMDNSRLPMAPGTRPPLASGTRHLTANRITQKVPQGPSPCSSLSSGSASATPTNDLVINERGMPHSASTPTPISSIPNNPVIKGSASFSSPSPSSKQDEENHTHSHQGPEERTHRRQGSDTSRPDKLKLFSHLKRSPNHSLFRVRSNIEQSPSKKQQQQQQQQHTFVQPKGTPVATRINQFGGGGSRGGSMRDQKKPQYARPDHPDHRQVQLTRHLSNEELSAPSPSNEKREEPKTKRTHERKPSDSSEDMKSFSYPLLQGGRRYDEEQADMPRPTHKEKRTSPHLNEPSNIGPTPHHRSPTHNSHTHQNLVSPTSSIEELATINNKQEDIPNNSRSPPTAVVPPHKQNMSPSTSPYSHAPRPLYSSHSRLQNTYQPHNPHPVAYYQYPPRSLYERKPGPVMKGLGSIQAAHTAAANGDIVVLHKLISSGNINPLSPDEYGSSLIHKAVAFGHLKALQLLASEVSPDALLIADGNLMTPTMLAIQGGHIDCLKWLVEERRIPLTMPEREGESLLHHAAYNGQLECLDYLVHIAQKLDITDSVYIGDSGVTPAHFAAQRGSLDCLRLLISKGFDVTLPDEDNMTPADWADAMGEHSCTHFLLMVEMCWSLVRDVSILTQRVEMLTQENEQLHDLLQVRDHEHNSTIAKLNQQHQETIHKVHKKYAGSGEEVKEEQATSPPPTNGIKTALSTGQKVAVKNPDIKKKVKIIPEPIKINEIPPASPQDLLQRQMSNVQERLIASRELRKTQSVMATRSFSPLSPVLKRISSNETGEKNVFILDEKSTQNDQLSKKTSSNKVANDFLSEDLFQPSDAATEITDTVNDNANEEDLENGDSQHVTTPTSPRHSSKASKSSHTSYSRPLQPTGQRRSTQGLYFSRMGQDGLGMRTHPLSYAQAGHYTRPHRSSHDHSYPHGTCQEDGSLNDSSHVTGHMTPVNHYAQSSQKLSTKVNNS